MRTIPDLVTTHRVIVPDLPGHGASTVTANAMDADAVKAWLGELIEQTCPTPPTLVGHLLGGAIATRFASNHSDRLRGLVLVDTFGLGPFRPSATFAFVLVRFLVRPSDRAYHSFLDQCLVGSGRPGRADGRGLGAVPGVQPRAFADAECESLHANHDEGDRGTHDTGSGRRANHRSDVPDLGPRRPRRTARNCQRRERLLRMASACDR
ncbi:alpha/beta fold hydrolase [Natronosalvus rutilus]|uniref:alpha/beta fold hydrolase n=1 Tax=Natronosalvus rutilus TaxID=2953753 RepID=UPI003CCCE1B5